MDRLDRLAGCLVGEAVGDSLALPREGLTRRRAARIFGGPPLQHAFFLGRGMISDDTEHAAMTAQALLACPDDPDRFARRLAWKLRWWLLALPAGVGFGTLRALLKLWLGLPPGRAGVRSAGNGPAMRAPIIGACLAGDRERREALVRAATRLTHREARAEEGALAVALAAAHAATRAPGEVKPAAFLDELLTAVGGEELRAALLQAKEYLARGDSLEEFLAARGQGQKVSGYVNQTVPACLYAWLSSPGDFRRAVESVALAGGDADTTAAITGAIAGAGVGLAGIPAEWRDRLRDWPRSAAWLESLAGRLARRFPAAGEGEAVGPQPLFWPGVFPRNLFFLLVVLYHGFRRLAPPY